MSSKWRCILRGLKGLCPQCGKGLLFYKYLKQVKVCDVCHHPWGGIRADDGPAWMTMMLILHLLIPFFIFLTKIEGISDFLLIGILLIVAFILSLIVLPKAKAFFITMIWLNQAGEARSLGEDDKS